MMQGSNWRKWCRLCAREDAERNLDVFAPSELSLTGTTLATAIGKYFWVNIKPNDNISQVVCVECHSLLTSLVAFTERVNKVQAMFTVLQNTNTADPLDPYEIRIQYGLLQEEHDLVIQTHNVEVSATKGHNESEDYAEGILEEIVTEELDGEVEEFVQPDTEAYTDEYDDISIVEKKINAFVKRSKNVIVEGQDEEQLVLEDSDVELDLSEEIADDDGKLKKMLEEEDVEVEGGEEDNEMEEDEMMLEFKEEFIDNASYATSEYCRKKDSTKSTASQGTLDQLINPKRGRPRLASGDNMQRYECKYCPKKYKNPTSFRKHMLEIHESKDEIPEFICEHCEKVCPTENQLNVHVRTHLPLEQKLDIPCPLCDRMFTKSAVMRQHVRGFHHNEKPYTCDQCGRRLKTLAALNEHKLVHTSETPYECDRCQKRFKNKARLKMHYETHAETALICTECGLQLNTRRTLKMHMLVHSEEKKFKCDFCDAIFKRSKALKNHLILHTGLRPYACPFCSKTFTNGSNCRAHKKKSHPRELAAQEAEGVATAPISVPNIDDLRSHPLIHESPRQYNKLSIGLSPRMRALLIAAEKRKKQQQCNDDIQVDDDQSLINGSESDSQEMVELAVDDMDGEFDEGGEETIVYEVIDEI